MIPFPWAVGRGSHTQSFESGRRTQRADKFAPDEYVWESCVAQKLGWARLAKYDVRPPWWSLERAAMHGAERPNLRERSDLAA